MVLTTRRVGHDVVSASLAALDDGQLGALVDAALEDAVGVGGGSSVLDIDGTAVFAKRVPITDLELAHPLSTANLFDLPTACQYGMHPLAGPGFGAWRELAANIIVTEGVLAGATESFALLHHWRVLPARPPIASEHQDIEAVVAQFGGDPSVRTRLEALAGASSSLVLFLEHIPDPLLEWLNDDPVGRAETFERQLFEAVAFLRDRELLHMDGHFGNMRAGDEKGLSGGTDPRPRCEGRSAAPISKFPVRPTGRQSTTPAQAPPTSTARQDDSPPTRPSSRKRCSR